MRGADVAVLIGCIGGTGLYALDNLTPVYVDSCAHIT